MKELDSLAVSPVMLKKNPDIVTTIKKVNLSLKTVHFRNRRQNTLQYFTVFVYGLYLLT